MTQYQPLTGRILSVELLEDIPSFVDRSPRRRGKKGMGLRYEAKVHRHLLDRYDYIPGPWFKYSISDDPKRNNYAQPDGLLIDLEKGIITIVEIKYNHCVQAYFQLLDRYVPLVDAFFNNSDISPPLWKIATVEVVYWYDCGVAFPTKVVPRKYLKDVQLGEFAVHICRPE